MKQYPEIALTIKAELADCIWNGVEEVSHRGTDFYLQEASVVVRNGNFYYFEVHLDVCTSILCVSSSWNGII